MTVVQQGIYATDVVQIEKILLLIIVELVMHVLNLWIITAGSSDNVSVKVTSNTLCNIACIFLGSFFMELINLYSFVYKITQVMDMESKG